MKRWGLCYLDIRFVHLLLQLSEIIFVKESVHNDSVALR